MDQPLNPDHIPARRLINRELMAETAAQIRKDLRLESLHVSEDSEINPFDALFTAVLPIVRSILTDYVMDLPQHLYQVDLPERRVTEALESDDPAAAISEAIIRRCFQKVVLRKLHSRR